MKRFFALFCICSMILSGCSSDAPMEEALGLRRRLLDCSLCSFQADVTADYGEMLYEFTMECRYEQGKFTYRVLKPRSIAGVSGEITEKDSSLMFDGQVLAFRPICGGRITPVTAPWLVLRTLRSGCLLSCGTDGDYRLLTAEDSYGEKPLRLDIWLGPGGVPVRGEILWENRRNVTVVLENFQLSAAE